VKAAPFAYAKPRALEEALELAARPNAKVLAGGQSLIASLNMRLSSPDLLVDISGLKELKGISLERGVVRIGALATHTEIENSKVIQEHLPLFAAAVRHIAEAAKFVPLENLCLSPQCGFSSTHHGNVLSEDDQWRKLELIVETAREVWA